MLLVKECETTYTNVLEIDRESISRLARELSLDESRFYKNVKRLNHAEFKKMSVYGLFTMDAGLLVGLIQMITTYVIVLLQFALSDQTTKKTTLSE
ncbi:unnamed protein product [Leptosia nina]|uniref:Gustatory receptor n=1 Tax=Leptosia nina TaxID=320188 RepID=A0AAV1J1N0_9NEOP